MATMAAMPPSPRVETTKSRSSNLKLGAAGSDFKAASLVTFPSLSTNPVATERTLWSPCPTKTQVVVGRMLSCHPFRLVESYVHCNGLLLSVAIIELLADGQYIALSHEKRQQ